MYSVAVLDEDLIIREFHALSYNEAVKKCVLLVEELSNSGVDLRQVVDAISEDGEFPVVLVDGSVVVVAIACAEQLAAPVGVEGNGLLLSTELTSWNC